MDLNELVRGLQPRDPGFVGCTRRGKWSEPRWRDVRGNAFRSHFGIMRYVETPEGPLQTYLTKDGKLLQFRGGPWKDYWFEDALDEWSAIYEFTDLELDEEIIFLWENQGELAIRRRNVDLNFHDPKERMIEKLDAIRSDPPGRIKKDRPRAYKECQYCPVRRKCDAVDQREGDTDDWGANYAETR